MGKLEKKIIVKLQGGLGNQMFQYAFGRALADTHSLELFLDCHFLKDRSPKEGFTFRDFELGTFPIRAAMADDKILKSIAAYPRGRGERFKQLLLVKTGQVNYISENGFHHSAVRAADLKKKNYFTGFWQSEKYFETAENNIRRDFSFKLAPTENHDKYSALINDAEAVSIHVRRGDYVNNLSHPLCTIDYYKKAIELITQSVANPVFFIFSDDPAWVLDNLRLTWPSHVVEGNSNMMDLSLMSSCKHHIIANSSFSWWGAWLNDSNDKKVIAPEQWFGNSQINTEDLIPENWIRL